MVLHHWCEGLKFIHKIFFSICLPRHLYHTRVGMVYSASCRKLCHSTKPWVTYCTCMLHLLHIGGCQSNSVTHEGKHQWCGQFLSLQISVDSSIAEFLASFLSAWYTEAKGMNNECAIVFLDINLYYSCKVCLQDCT